MEQIRPGQCLSSYSHRHNGQEDCERRKERRCIITGEVGRRISLKIFFHLKTSKDDRGRQEIVQRKDMRDFRNKQRVWAYRCVKGLLYEQSHVMGAASGPVTEKMMVLALKCIWREGSLLGSPGWQHKHPGFCQAEHCPVVWAAEAEAEQVSEDC